MTWRRHCVRDGVAPSANELAWFYMGSDSVRSGRSRSVKLRSVSLPIQRTRVTRVTRDDFRFSISTTQMNYQFHTSVLYIHLPGYLPPLFLFIKQTMRSTRISKAMAHISPINQPCVAMSTCLLVMAAKIKIKKGQNEPILTFLSFEMFWLIYHADHQKQQHKTLASTVKYKLTCVEHQGNKNLKSLFLWQ